MTTNNGTTMNAKQKREAAKAAALLVAARNTLPEVGYQADGGPLPGNGTPGTDPEQNKDDTITVKKKNHHGPYTSREEASKYPVKGERKAKEKQGTGKDAKMIQVKNADNTDKMEEFVHTIFSVSVPVAALQKMIDAAVGGTFCEYWYGVTSTNAAANYCGGHDVVLSQGDGSGRGSAMTSLRQAASEAEVRAATALANLIAERKANQDSINAARSAQVLQYVQLFRAMPDTMRATAYGIISDATVRAEVEAALTV